MTSGLYTMLGTYYTLQALMGAMLDLMIKLLMALAIIIVGLWVMPFTWPAAASMTAVFLGISVPLSIIIYFMTEVLHIKTSSIPKLRCFDKHTKCTLKNGTTKNMQDIQPSDVLMDGSVVTSKIKILAQDLIMYNLNGIIVSECHIVSYNTEWIPVYKHPKAVKVNDYNEPYLYCLNTTSKIIRLNDMDFTDWDEVYGNKLELLLKQNKIKTDIQFAEMFNEGFEQSVSIKTKNGNKYISNIQVGEELLDGSIVYGIVELTNDLGKNKLSNPLDNKLFNLLVSNGIFKTENNGIHPDYNWKIDAHLENIKYKNII
jgi:hypothetical protein